MRTKSLLAVLATMMFAVGCGGDDDGGGTPDARPSTPDAPPGGGPDAPPMGMIDAGPMNPPAMGLGQVCDGTNMCPTGGAMYICTTLDMDNTDGLCTLSCGTSADTMTPPAGGDATCSMAYTGTIGSARCVLYDTMSMPPNVQWYCGILCSATNECPGGLTAMPVSGGCLCVN